MITLPVVQPWWANGVPRCCAKCPQNWQRLKKDGTKRRYGRRVCQVQSEAHGYPISVHGTDVCIPAVQRMASKLGEPA